MTPDDVFNLVVDRTATTQRMIAWAIVLLAVNLFVLLTVVLPSAVMFIRDKRTREKQYEQNKRILDMAEKHGGLTDEKYKQKAQLIAEEVRHILELKQVAEETKRDVKEVKDKTTVTMEATLRVEEKLPEDPSKVLFAAVVPRDPNTRDRAGDPPSGEFKK